jgi:hypothetical protein
MVTNTALATICVETELYTYIIHDSPALQTSIDDYVRELKKAQNLEYQLAESEGRTPGQYWVDVEPPKAGEKYLVNGFLTEHPHVLLGVVRCRRVHLRSHPRIR